MPSRLVRHQKKQNLYILVGIGVFILFFLFVGIPFFAQGSFFFTSLFKPKDVETQDEVLGNVEITDIPDSTSSASIRIAGYAENFDKVRVVLNSDDEDEKKLDENDEFEMAVNGLRGGDNEIYIIAVKNNSKQKKSSDTYHVVYYKDKPKLDIKEPGDNSKTSRDEVNVGGQTDTGNSVTINGSPVVVDASGNFNSSARLKEGENKIIVRASNDAGAYEEKTLTVTYEKN